MTIPDGTGVRVSHKEFPPEVLEDFREMDDNGRWFEENHDALQREHPNRLVAVHRRRVISSAESLDVLLSELRGNDMPRLTQVLIRFVPDGDTILIY
jgi:hypothetical protein